MMIMATNEFKLARFKSHKRAQQRAAAAAKEDIINQHRPGCAQWKLALFAFVASQAKPAGP